MSEKVATLIRKIESEGYADVEFNYESEESEHKEFIFEGFSDASVEIKVEEIKKTIKKLVTVSYVFYDRYVGEKHWVHQGNLK